MYYNMVFDITVGKFKLNLLESVEVQKSVDLLADACTIVLPGSAYNQALKIEDEIKRGDRVTVIFGYDDIAEAKPEFEGYLQEISTDGGSITLRCENDIWLTRKAIPNKVFSKAKLEDIVKYVLDKSADGKLKLNCTYDMTYDKFVIHNSTGFEVLQKLQEEIQANIFVAGDTLNVLLPYEEEFGKVKYDFARNVEQCNLKYRTAEDRDCQVEVEGINKSGTHFTAAVGKAGGDKRTFKVHGVTDKKELEKCAEKKYSFLVYDGYEGSITAWLEPLVAPGYSAVVVDKDYEHKNGTYYVVGVTTTFSASGGVRKVELGRKIS